MGPITFIIYLSIYIGLIATSFYVLTYVSGRKQELLFTDKELPNVTVIIPALNEEKTIERTIESAVNSDYPDDKLEIIVIDDGSTDNTLKIAKKVAKKYKDKIKVISKQQGGKATAVNLGIKKSKGEIIFTMDADTVVPPKSLKNMVRYFKDKEIMCVSPGITTHPPKNILQRVQHIEYVLGLFLRKTFAILNAIHITPGAFSAYRKTFFEKHGGYEEGNITEDLEMAMRIQYYGYRIENSPESPVYTSPPEKFIHLLKQRRRWYVGLIKNTWKYKKLISPKYGDMGMFVLPIAWISIFFAVIITTYFFFDAIFNIKNEILFLKSVNYDFSSIINLNLFVLERFIFRLFSNSIFIFVLFFVIIVISYLFYASQKLGKVHNIWFNLPIFFLFFSVLFGFWWIISVAYVTLNRNVSWR